MDPIHIEYREARKLMQPGDVIAFGGKSFFSEIIKFSTASKISHVGVILQTQVLNESNNRFFNQIIESSTWDDFSGVKISRFSDRLYEYDGEIWWLPLKKEIRNNQFDQSKFYDFLFKQGEDRVKYDFPQGVKSAVDILDKLPFDLRGPSNNKEDLSKFFCSELVAAGLEIAGVTGSINVSEVTPIDLCRWDIYEPRYYQLKGDPIPIKRFNTRTPSEWNAE